MSHENVEAVRGIWEAVARFEFPADAFAEDVRWHTARDLPDPETCTGPAAVQGMLAEGGENGGEPGWPGGVLDAGEVVAVRWRGWGTGRGSGIPVEWHEAHTYALQDGKVVEVREF